MKRSANHDMTSGSIMSRLIAVAVPIMGTQLLSMLYNFVDMFWLGRIEHAVPGGAIAASGAAGMYMWLSVGMMLVGRMGSEIGVSQNLGRGDRAAAVSFSQNSFLLALLLGTLYGAAMVIFRNPLISFFGINDARVASDGALYLSIIGLGIPASYVSSQLVGAFNASGNARTPFIVSTIGVALNMALDPLFIFVFNWGIAGAAIATIMSQYIVAIVGLLVIKYSKNRPFEHYKFFAKPDFSKMKQIIRWTIPPFIENTAFCFLSMITQRFVNSFGTAPFTVAQIGGQIESFSWLVSGGFGTAVVAFIGQNFGAGKFDRIKSGYRLSVAAMAAWGIIVSVGLFFGGRYMFMLFTNDADVIALGTTYLSIMCIGQAFSCVESVASSSFKGIGKTIPPAVVSFTINVGRVFLAWALMNTQLGLNGIWVAFVIGMVLRGTWATVWWLVHSKRKLVA